MATSAGDVVMEALGSEPLSIGVRAPDDRLGVRVCLDRTSYDVGG